MTNFDFLKNTPDFDAFADVAISAEKILHIDVDSCVLNCRRAMEFAVKWMYSVDASLEMPYQDNLLSLMNNEDFREIVGMDIEKAYLQGRFDAIPYVDESLANFKN